MNKEEVYEGKWFIATVEKPPAFGLLTVGVSSLKLVATRYENAGLFQSMERTKVSETIHGIDANGVELTLFGCSSLNAISRANLEKFEIIPIAAIVGGHFERIEDVECESIQCRFSLLEEWFFFQSTSIQVVESKLVATQTRASEIATVLEDGTKCKIWMNLNSLNHMKRTILSHNIFVQFCFSNERSLLKVETYLHSFRKMLSFFTGKQVFSEEVQLRQTNQINTSLKYLRRGSSSQEKSLSLDLDEPLVPYREVSKDFPNIIQRWFSYMKIMGPIVDLYLSAKFEGHLTSSTRFLLLAQALEAYHSRSERFVGTIQSKPEFIGRRDAILKGISDPTEAEWLKGKLMHANNKTLADRLKDLFRDQPDIQKFIPNPEAFAKKIRWTRNYHTHYDLAEENRDISRIATGKVLVECILKMQALFELLLLHDLQLPAICKDRVCHRANQHQIITLED